ncbi:kinase-like domain-containing protein [Aspergillus keveii]|uniref:Kinase-like domain-containing protein n=1 Tax=Aspergillus keveii TaxID=714993 RepID=A0ABR4GCB9_9EURO
MVCPCVKTTADTEEPMQQHIVGVGQFATIHNINNKTARKIPSDKSYTYSVEAVEIEAKIYKHLGKHKRIAKCIRCSNDYIDLRYEPNGNLETYLADKPVSAQWRYRLARQAIEAVVYIHKMHVIQSDLSARQFLFLPRDKESSNTVQSDLFALGSTIHEILIGRKPYDGVEDEEVQRLYSNREFPTLEDIESAHWRKAILKCWKTEYESASEILEDLPAVPLPTRIFLNLQLALRWLK